MPEPIITLPALTIDLVDLAVVALFVALAWLVRRRSWQLARRLVRLSRFAPRERAQRPARRRTLQGIIADTISTLAVLAAVLVTVVRLFSVEADTVVWVVGLFSAAFGFGARPLISDLLAGASFIFEDSFSVGEKVEMLGVEGVIEAVNLRTTALRSPTGELYVLPNGDIRLVRNFSRGRFSTASITVHLSGADVARALPLLTALGEALADELPDLIEPWQVISPEGVLSDQTPLTLVVKARFGHGAELRTQLLALIHERLAEAGIELGAPSAD